jgi:hypothetical protein
MLQNALTSQNVCKTEKERQNEEYVFFPHPKQLSPPTIVFLPQTLSGEDRQYDSTHGKCPDQANADTK